MYRGTTPTITINCDIDVSEFVTMWVTFRTQQLATYAPPKQVEVTKHLGDEGVDATDKVVTVSLTQADTLLLGSLPPDEDQQVEVQIRGRTEDGRAFASNIMTAPLSRILKDGHEDIRLLSLLPDYDQRLCQVGALLISYRARFYQSLGQEAARFHSRFSGGAEEFRLEYKTVSTVKDPFAPVAQLREDLREHLDAHGRAELQSCSCLTGPHKDDFTITLSGVDLKSYGSQGQTRTAAISLKLAQRELMKREFGEEPLLLLDDVLSELDEKRQDFVLNQISSGQVFITCCEPGRFTKLGKTMEISGGSLINPLLGKGGTPKA